MIFLKLCYYEFKQSLIYFLVLILISLAVGGSISVAQKAFQKLRAMAEVTPWGADLIILPKGISVADFHDELLTGKQNEYIPKNLFDTMVDMSESKFHMQAVLVHGDAESPLYANLGENLGTNWLPTNVKPDTWSEDLVLRNHATWGKKVVSAIFSSGAATYMKNLKDLVDQKTVAQAYYLKDEEEKAAVKAQQLQVVIVSFLAVLAVLELAGFVLIYLTFANRFRQTLKVMFENGFTQKMRLSFMLVLVATTVIFPLLVGFGLIATLDLPALFR